MELLPNFTLLRPESVDEAVSLRAAHPGARILAGGTDLLPNMRRGLVETETVIDLAGCDELRTLDGGHIGAMVTLETVAEACADYPALAQAAVAVAGPTHRGVATVGGNLCLDTRCIFYNQSEWWRKSNEYCLKYGGDICHVVPSNKRCYAVYSGDLAAALALYGAEVEIAGANGRRRVPLDTLLQDDGMDHLALEDGELVVAVHLPPQPPGLRSAYREIRVRGSIDFSLAGVAVGLVVEGDTVTSLSAGLTGTNAAPLVVEIPAADTETAATALEKAIQKAVSPVRTALIQPQYRRRAVAALAAHMVRDLAG
jgi:4-hydroxybenzoyl-CoA reductase subunit beta